MPAAGRERKKKEEEAKIQKPRQASPATRPSLIHSVHSLAPSFHPGLLHSAVQAAGPFPQHPWGEANPSGGV